MPLVNGKVVLTVPCSCGGPVNLSSGTYGVYCPTCGEPVFTHAYLEQIHEELKVVITAERKRMRKEHSLNPPMWNVGSSALISSCAMCSGTLNKVFVVDGEPLCESCYNTYTRACSSCGEHHLIKYLKDGICESCIVSFRKCPTCGYRYDIRKTKSFTVNGKVFCDNCVETYLHARGVSYRGYSYKPTPIMFGDKVDGMYFGVELEMDNSNRRNEFMARSNTDEIYYKADGSLVSGVEVVTHPATLKYHMTEFPWQNILKTAKMCGFKSHMGTSGDKHSNHPTCGLHIHVNSAAFGRTIDERDKREAKLLVLVEKFWSKLVIFSRRDKESLERWARRYADFDVTTDHLTDIIAKAKDYNGSHRHVAINFSANGGKTVEFRMFRGTLQYETLIASIQLVKMLVDATRLPTSKVQSLSWEEFTHTDYVEFNGYLERLRSDKKKI